MCGESGAVNQGTVDDFTSKLPSVCESYVVSTWMRREYLVVHSQTSH